MKRLVGAVAGLVLGSLVFVHVIGTAHAGGTAQNAGAAVAGGLRATAPPEPARLPAARGLIIGAVAKSTAAFTTATGVHPAILEHYVHPPDPFSAAFAGNAEPLIQIEPSKIPLSDLVAGKYDSWLRSFAEAVVAYRKPVILGFGAEMNGTWSSWGWTHVKPAVFVAAWRHVVSVFRAAGARNVTWIWTVNVIHKNWHIASPDAWWPGASWVDVVGVDGYYYGSSQGFTDLFGPALADIRKLTGKPVLIAETAATSTAGKPAKVAETFAGARKAGLLGLVWFDMTGVHDWRLDGDAAAVAAFREAAKQYGL